MKRKLKLMAFFLAALGLAALLSPPQRLRIATAAALAGMLHAQESVPTQKPTFDYMSTYLSRNTKPLGLEEDKEIKELMQQPAVKWAIRANIRHSLQ
ncbi:MAG TPA: hypothetical protein VGB72_08450 [Acidobacteriota bacterium]